ncbi:MAG: glycosyltransferase, partial [Lentisphaerae bacterium]|nr:glycosyltransferase [Lentisphaerota bacterium]
DLGRGLQGLGHRVQVLTMYDKGGYAAAMGREWGLPIRDLEMKRPGSRNPPAAVWRVLRGMWRLYRSLRADRIDVLQTFTHYSNMIGTVVGWAARVPVRVASQQNARRAAPRWMLRLDACVANSRCVHMMTAVSEATRRFSIETQGMRAEKVRTIYAGIDMDAVPPRPSGEARRTLRRRLGLPESGRILITVARLHPQKGHGTLIAAARGVCAEFPDVRFVWVGDGPERARLEAAVHAAGLDSAVILLGVRMDIWDLLAAADVFVLPSFWEGLPNAVLEAMAAGLPVAASRVDGCAEAVEDGVTGILVEPGDPVALGEAVRHILRDARLADAMSQAGRERVHRMFALRETVRCYNALYCGLLAKRV